MEALEYVLLGRQSAKIDTLLVEIEKIAKDIQDLKRKFDNGNNGNGNGNGNGNNGNGNGNNGNNGNGNGNGH